MTTSNSAIELHDSEVGAVTSDGSKTTIHFSSAFIHKSNGNPGVQVGTVWTQAVVLTIEASNISGLLPELPCVIWEGDFKIDAADQLGLIPIPLVDSSTVELVLKFDTVHSVRIQGRKPNLVLLGIPKFAEYFPNPTNNSAEPK